MNAVGRMSIDPRLLIDEAPMSRPQIIALAMTVALSGLDGYDVLSATFAAPGISHAWGIGKAALGLVLSSGLVGMAMGSLGLAPLADLMGRRRLVLLSLLLMAIGMLLSTFATSVAVLACWRVVTGLGIGALVAVINPLAAEFSNTQRRPLALSAMTVGYPAGGVIGGFLAAWLMHDYGWPAIFMAGFGLALVMLLLTSVFLPESPAFILSGRQGDGLAKINAWLIRCGHLPVDTLPPTPKTDRPGYAGIFKGESLPFTVLITLANMLFVMTVYYVLSWLPQMVADAGFPASIGSVVSATANLAGVIGGLFLGWAARWTGVRALLIVSMAGLAATTAAFGFSPPSLGLLFAAATVSGFFLFGGMAGLYATLGTAFGASTRASGTGFVIGVGRIGSAIAPLLAGWLFASGVQRAGVSLVFAGFAAVAAAALGSWGLLMARSRRRFL